jgi:hypothetical protein
MSFVATWKSALAFMAPLVHYSPGIWLTGTTYEKGKNVWSGGELFVGP